jgi:hypothetical protein
MVSGDLKRIEQLANFAVTGNTHGESIMIDRRPCMNQIATAFGHDMEGKSGQKRLLGGIAIMGVMLDTVGKIIAGYLQKEVPGYEPFTPSDPEHLRGIIEPGDVLLVEGNNRISGIIKYLTQSTWSHAALYVGPVDGAQEPDGEPHVLIEAYIGEGVVSAPLSKYFPYHTRLCRPVGLSYEDRTTVCRYAINRIGFGYDTKNILDLMRFLIPLPIPQRWRRRLIAFGSGDPTKIICSALIAQAFDAVRYPILPKITRAGSRQARREILHIRDSSLYMPRDFDISPYFEVVKPTIVHGFDYTALHWADKQKPLQEVAGEFGVFPETLESPPLVPKALDEEAPVPAAEVAARDAAPLVERVTVAEHYIVVEYVEACLPERRARLRVVA